MALTLAFVFGTWAYQARGPSIPSNCFIAEDGDEICGSINGAAYHHVGTVLLPRGCFREPHIPCVPTIVAGQRRLMLRHNPPPV